MDRSTGGTTGPNCDAAASNGCSKTKPLGPVKTQDPPTGKAPSGSGYNAKYNTMAL